jgi:flagellar biosynthesis GTPase FlhF
MNFKGCHIQTHGNIYGPTHFGSQAESEEDAEYSDSMNPEKELTTLEATLCPSNLTCYSPSSRTWFSASVSRLSEIKWNASAWDHLVLDQDIKDTIMTLVQQHRVRSNEEVIGDVIEGKGNVRIRLVARYVPSLTSPTQGLVIALHGPPGVGKTLTAGELRYNCKTSLLNME